MKQAFTLAETLITLAVIGVVAALTIPSMIQNYNDRKYQSAYKKMYSTLMNGFNQMIAEDNIAGHSSTEDFVREMGKYFKISATCDKDNLKNCFSEKIKTQDEEIELSDIKSSKNLGKVWTTDTNVNGILLSDGTSMLIAYNKDGCSEHAKDREDQIKSCVAVVYDLDSKVKGGKYSPIGTDNVAKSDINLYNAIFNTGIDCGELSIDRDESSRGPFSLVYYTGSDAGTDECIAQLNSYANTAYCRTTFGNTYSYAGTYDVPSIPKSKVIVCSDGPFSESALQNL